MGRNNRYHQMEQLMTKALIADAAAFLVYLLAAGNSIIWLKVATAIGTIVISLAALVFLFLSRELFKKRSLWLSTGFFSLFMCVLASLILAYP